MFQVFSIGLALVLYHIFFYPLLVPYPGSIGFTVLVAILNTCLAIAFFKSKKSQPLLIYFLQMLSVSAAILGLFRASDVDQLLLSMTSMGLWLVAGYFTIAQERKLHAAGEIFSVPFDLLRGWIAGLFTTASAIPKGISVISSAARGQREKNEARVKIMLRGSLLAVPVLLLLVVLLASADPIFSSLIEKIFTIQIPDKLIPTIERLVATCVFLFFVAPIAYAKLTTTFQSPFQKATFHKFSGEIGVMVGLVSVVLAAFLLIQFKYLFAHVAETDLHRFGINTYSEYVRKGFAELTVVTVLTYSIASLGYIAFRKARSNKMLAVNLFLIGELALFIFSIFRRVLLYQVEHGLTRIRMYGSLFLVLLLILTAILVLRHILKRNVAWYQFEFGAALFMVFIATSLNIDRLIATTFHPTVNGEVDYVYISRLSTDASQGWADAYKYAYDVANDPILASKQEYSSDEYRRLWYAQYITYELLTTLDALKRYEEFPTSTLQTLIKKDYNIAEKRAYEQIKKSLSYDEMEKTYEQLNQMINMFDQLRQKNATQPKDQKGGAQINYSLDRSLNSPLVK